MATSVIVDENLIDEDDRNDDCFTENEILKDWFEADEENSN